MRGFTLPVALLAASAHAWMPADRELEAFNRTSGSLDKRAHALPSYKIRGVNLGGWLISEPWMMSTEWANMGCPSPCPNNCGTNKCTEFDCVSAQGQSKADQTFNAHYARWITPQTIQDIHNAGLNTIRIPIGYWSYRPIVDSSEHFPNMDLKYLDAVIQKAADLGMFVVIDLHGAPGSQKVGDAFTGQCLPKEYLPGFFSPANYKRAATWLDWMTRRIHTTPSYKAAVGILEVVNEPQRDGDDGGRPQSEKDTLTQNYYPQALAAVRAAETALNIPTAERLHVQFMDQLWGVGNPKSNIPTSDTNVVFDDHNYAAYAVPDGPKQGDYMYYTCFTDNRLTDGDVPKLVGEWSLTVKDESSSEFSWSNPSNEAFYKQWFIAQQRLYEQTNGWIFWSWKTELNDPRWDYSYLVYKKWIATNAGELDASRATDVCKNYWGRSDGRG